MKNTALKNTLIWGSIIALVGGIAWYVKSNVVMAMSFCYRITGFRFISDPLNVSNGLKFEFDVKLKNWSEFKATVTSYDFDVSLNGVFLANVKNDTNTVIESNGISILKVPVTVDLKKSTNVNIKQIVKIAADFWVDKSSLAITTKGHLSGKVGVLKVNDFPLEIKMTYPEIIAPVPDDDICKNFK